MMHKFFLFILLVFCQVSSADVGTISKVRGQVEIMSSFKLSDANPVVYQGHKLFLSEASPGDKVKKGDIVRTGKASLVRIIFENGDQFMIGPGSEYQLTRPSKSDKQSSLINLARGKFRAVISKDGPRNDMEVKTNVASLGIRGTDFFVENLNYRESEVSVLRGEVEVRSIKNNEKPKIVRSGFLGEVKKFKVKAPKEISSGELKESIETTIKKTSKSKVLNIQKETNTGEVTREKLPESKEKKIRALEARAVKATLKDIRHYDPELFNEIQEQKKISSADELNAQVVAKAFKNAQEEEKLSKDQIEEIQEDPYGKYFDVDSL